MFGATIQAIFALAATLGLFGVAVYAFRRWGPVGLVKLNLRPADKRLVLVESLMLDAQRRLVLVKLDAREHLILLGEGRQIDTNTELDRG